MEGRDLNLVRRTKKKQMIFVLLLTTALVFLFSYTRVYDSVLNQWFVSGCVRKAVLELKPPPEVQRCSYSHLSAENQKDGRRLLDSLWPQTPPLTRPFSLTGTTSAARSSFRLGPQRRVGERLSVEVQLRDFAGKPKRSGGDFLICRLHGPALGAAVVGQVHDHLNGTFTAVFPLLWNGTAEVQVTLVQSSESITVLKRLTEQQPDRIFFASDFTNGSVTQRTVCNVCLDPDRGPVCNFTDSVTGEQWFCHKPPSLGCNTRISHVKQGIKVNSSREERTLFQSGVNMKAPVKPSGDKTLVILPKEGAPQKASPGPSGYYYGNEWRPLQGPGVRPFNSDVAITACLKGKQLHLFGDSTVRQFYEFIVSKVPNLMKFDKHSSPQCGPFLAVDYSNDIMMTYRGHGPPFRSYQILVSQMRYVANELDRLAGGANTVVVVGVWAHFTTFPLEVYYQRLMSVRRAVQRLLHRAPGTKVIVRTANLSLLTNSGSLTDSDWYLWQLNKILRAVFEGSPVLLLEAWEMVQASHLPHNIHPPPQIIKLMVDHILSYTCPGK